MVRVALRNPGPRVRVRSRRGSALLLLARGVGQPPPAPRGGRIPDPVLLGSFVGFLHFLSHLPIRPHLPVPPNASSSTQLDQLQQLPTPHQLQQAAFESGGADEYGDKLLILITPTRARASHAYYLSRLGQMLRLVRPPELRIVVEAGKPTPEAALALPHTATMYLYVRCCDNLNASSSSSIDYRLLQMNAGLELVENHRLDGVVYFADEDGVYSLHRFDRLRQIRRFGT